jgi:predicted TIM-barrel fold metal-dependent hydrolase
MPIDTHVHLASDDLRKYPWAEVRPFATDTYENTAERLLGLMDEAGVEGALVVQPFGVYGYDNAYHADAAAAHPDRFVGVCGLSAALPDAPALLRHLVRERGMGGLRVTSRGDEVGFDDPRFLELMAEAERLAIPVCVLTSLKRLPSVHALARRYPGLTIALDHLGGQLADPDEVVEGLRELAAAPNIFLKFSTPLLTAGPPHETLLPRLIERFGAERLMWGTNYPVTDEGGYASMVEFAREALSSLPETDQYALLSGTALRLWPQLQGAGR